MQLVSVDQTIIAANVTMQMVLRHDNSIVVSNGQPPPVTLDR